MPFEEHKCCKLPENMDAKIWRYMDFSKFVSLLEDQALFFCKVSSFDDPYEGFLTKPTAKTLMGIPDKLPSERRMAVEKIKKHNLKVIQSGKDLIYVSSWHISPYESVAMWNYYLKSGEGVAIQSTVRRMTDSFEQTDLPGYLGMVDYIDYSTDDIPYDNAFYLSLHKRKSFEYEKEIRALIMIAHSSTGVLVPVRLNTLIENIFVAPDSPSWVHELIKKVLKRYGIEKQVVHSGLEDRPLY